MTIFESKPPDPAAEARRQRRKKVLIGIVVLLLVAGAIAYWFRYWPEERVVDQFFNALEQKNYEKAYAIWRADPQWQQHVDRYSEYTFGQFQLDWGPTGDFGYINKHEVRGAVAPKSSNTQATGVIVATRVNDRMKPACLWVEKSSKAISFSPRDCAAP
ncbi:MAG: hypothetical protein JWO20_1650 [Candidatus Angelobacter sp.]|jgi:hypothetical protein|nr:hypothetical protein [Candidatus Angelobacter sp.]